MLKTEGVSWQSFEGFPQGEDDVDEMKEEDEVEIISFSCS